MMPEQHTVRVGEIAIANHLPLAVIVLNSSIATPMCASVTAHKVMYIPYLIKLESVNPIHSLSPPPEQLTEQCS